MWNGCRGKYNRKWGRFRGGIKWGCHRPRLFCRTGSKYILLFFMKVLYYSSIDQSSPAHARMSGPYGNRGNNESREQTIANGSLIRQGYFHVPNRLLSQRVKKSRALQIYFGCRKWFVLQPHACIPSQSNTSLPKVVKVWTWWLSVSTLPADKRKQEITC